MSNGSQISVGALGLRIQNIVRQIRELNELQKRVDEAEVRSRVRYVSASTRRSRVRRSSLR
jgi:hypothetical protein